MNENNIEKLAEKGIVVSKRTDGIYDLFKDKSFPGNAIPNWSNLPIEILDEQGNITQIIFSDCPSITFLNRKETYRVMHWDWEPGPGPGDFDLRFETEDEAVRFILNYYLEKNEYFESRRTYEVKKQMDHNS